MLELNTAIDATFKQWGTRISERIGERASSPVIGKCSVSAQTISPVNPSQKNYFKVISAYRLLKNDFLDCLIPHIKNKLLTLPRGVRENWSLKNITIWGLSVKGIRVEGKCPNCKSTRFRVDETKGFVCKNCLLPPPSDSRYFVDFFHEGQRIRRGTTLDGKSLRSFADAHALMRQAQNEKEVHKFDVSKWKEKEKKEFNFKVLITSWHQDKEELLKTNELAPSYVPMLMTYMMHYLIPYFGHMDIRDIRSSHIKDFKKTLSSMSPKGKDLSPKYRKNILGALSHFFECLIADEILEKKPRIPTIDVPEHDFEVISPETQAVLLTFIPDEHKPIFIFLFGQGCRPAEVRALKWECINDDTVTYKRTWSRRKLKETTKTRRIRKNYLFHDTRASLPPRRFPIDFVFTHGKIKKRPYSGDFLNKMFNSAVGQLNKKLEEAGETFRLKIALYEATKHSFGTYMRRKVGVDRDLLQKHFGHVKPEQTDKYLKYEVVDAFREIEARNKNVVSLIKVKKNRKKP